MKNNALSALAGLATPGLKPHGASAQMKRLKKAAPQVTPAAADIVQASTAAPEPEPEPESAPSLTPFQTLISDRLSTTTTLSYADVREAYKEFHAPKRVRFFASHMSKLADALAAHGISVRVWEGRSLV